jgi:SP family arabinose:H+ symporter-like MFS transporter
MPFAQVVREYPTCLAIAIFLPVTQQLCGINAIMLYAPQILEAMDLGISISLGGILTAFWNFLSTLSSLPFVDTLGRRPLLIGGFLGVAAGNLMVAAGFSIGNNVLCGVGLIVYLLGFELGPGPLYFVVVTEVFESRVKARLNGLSNALLWGMNLVISLFYLSVSAALGTVATFYCFLVVSLLGAGLSYAYVPETKGRVLSELHAELRRQPFPL